MVTPRLWASRLDCAAAQRLNSCRSTSFIGWLSVLLGARWAGAARRRLGSGGSGPGRGCGRWLGRGCRLAGRAAPLWPRPPVQALLQQVADGLAELAAEPVWPLALSPCCRTAAASAGAALAAAEQPAQAAEPAPSGPNRPLPISFSLA